MEWLLWTAATVAAFYFALRLALHFLFRNLRAK
jgi:hypothetical protein